MLYEINNTHMSNEDLIGVWKSDSNKKYGDVTMEFNSDRSLTYTVKEGDKKQIINLIYWVEDDYLYTDQPSSPKIEKTKISLDDTGKLVLDYEGMPTSFTKFKL